VQKPAKSDRLPQTLKLDSSLPAWSQPVDFDVALLGVRLVFETPKDLALLKN
jgi:hypothetical protein